MNPETMLDILKASAAESEEKSDKIAEDFLDSSLSMDEFLDQFKSVRIEMHLRKLKVDKMQELLRSGAGAGNGPQHMNYPGNNFYGPSTGHNSAPYPSIQPGAGGYPMPMPPIFRSPY